MERNTNTQNSMPQPNGKNPAPKKKKGKLFLIIGIIIAALILVLVIVVGSSKEEEPVEETTQPTEEAVIYGDEYYGIDARVDEELKNYRNVVLFGTDAKEIGTDQGNRSDAMMIISFNKETDEVKIFSVYRDSYLMIDDGFLDKVNHAYAYGGMDQSIKALNRNLDLNIREGMAFTWDAMANLIDKIGGVEVEIFDTEIAELNTRLSGSDQITSPGMQVLNGEQAVVYSRMRYDHVRGDHRRNERMQIVLVAALNKLKTMDTKTAIDIMDETLPEVKTNMSRNKMTDTLMKAADYAITTNICWPYDTKGWYKNEIYYGIPVTLHTNVQRLHLEMFGQTEYDPTDFVKNTSIQIESETGYSYAQ